MTEGLGNLLKVEAGCSTGAKKETDFIQNPTVGVTPRPTPKLSANRVMATLFFIV
jgi:hypothetical protein